MKRPLAVVGFTMLAVALVLCAVNRVWLCASAGVLSLMLLLWSLFRKNTKRAALLPTVFLSAGVACFLVLGFEAFSYTPALMQTGERISVQVTLCDYPERSGDRYYCVARLESANTKIKPKIRLSLSADEQTVSLLEAGDTVSFDGNVYVIAENSREIQRSFKSKGIFLGAYPTGEISSVEKGRHGLMYYIKRARRQTINQLLAAFDSDTAGLIISVLLGDKNYIGDETYTLFRNAGAAHVMAVSGLHLSIWILFVMKLVGYAGLDERRTAVFLLLFTLLIMAFALFSGSVVRAGLMMALYLFGFVLGKSSDSLNSLGFAAAVVIIHNPYACMNLSFMLSFVSTLAIIVLALPLSDLLLERFGPRDTRRKTQTVACAAVTSVAISVCVCLAALPITAYAFGCASTVSALTNILLLYAVQPLLIFSGLYVMFYFVPVLSSVLHLAASVFAKYCLFAVGLTGSLKGASYYFERETVVFWALLSVAVCVLLFFALRKRQRWLYLLTAAVFVLSVPCCMAADTAAQNSFKITVYSVGGGLVCSVSNKNQTAVIAFDCDDYYADLAAKSISESGEKVTVAVPDSEKVSRRLLEQLEAESIICPDINVLPVQLRDFYSDSQSITVGDGTIYLKDSSAYIEAYGKTAVITETDASADIVITNKTGTLDINEKSVIILSGEAGENSISTAEAGEITVRLRKNSEYYIKGENRWLYLMKSS